MKKVVFGCLGAAVLFAIVAAFAGYYLVYKPGKAFLEQTAKFREIPRLESNVENKAAYTAPANGEFTASQLNRMLAVQQSVITQLGTRAKQLEAKLKALDSSQGGPSRASLGDVISALKDLGTIVVDAKRVQVAALNQQKFSLTEYAWVRGAVYRAAGVPVGTEIADAIRAAAEGKEPAAPVSLERSGEPVPARNKELVAPHLEMLKQNAALVFFGL